MLRHLRETKYKILRYDKNQGSLKAYADTSWENGEGEKSFSGEVIQSGDSLIT